MLITVITKIHLGYGTVLMLLTIVGLTETTKDPKIFRKIESGLSVGGATLRNITATSKRHCSMGYETVEFK